MSLDAIGAGSLDYCPCRYGASKAVFRGPERRLDVPYVAFIGGTETYGKFIKTPFPALVESAIGVNCVNFGILNAGIDVFVNESEVAAAASNAKVSVVQVMGAQNMSNRFYRVHPRRNDRFVDASPLLATIYPEVDFAEFHFNRHMLSRLYNVCRNRFAIVRKELQEAWSARMRLLLTSIEGPVVLLWVAGHAPLKNERVGLDPSNSQPPLFVTREMIDGLQDLVSGTVEVCASKQAVHAGTEGMVFSEVEAVVARAMLGPKAHGEIAATLGTHLQDYL